MQVMGAWKFVRSSPCRSLSLSTPPSGLRSPPPYYLRLLSNTKNQIKYAKLRFEDFGEVETAEGS